MTEELRILLWAVTGDGPPPAVQPDLRTLLKLAYEHRLIPRLLYLLRRTRPVWSTPALLAGLQRENARAVVLHQQRIRALREIETAWAYCPAGNGQPLIAVKGFAVFALTGDPRHLRLSGDLDLFSPDPEALWRVLVDLGYTGPRHEGGFTEYANLRRAEVAIEVHRFFAVYSYPPGVAEADLSPERHPGAWRQSFGPIPRTALGYADLYAHSCCSDVELCRGLRVPTAELTVLLLCAHEFGETLHSPFEISVPVRLGIVADLLELAQQAAFDAEQFRSLVVEYEAEDAVRCIGAFIHLCGAALPPAFTAWEGPLPRQIGFRGGWAALTNPAEELLPSNHEGLFERLGPTRIVAGEEPARAEAMQAPERFLSHTVGPPELPVRLSVFRDAEGLGLEVSLPLLPGEQCEYRVRADGLWPDAPRLAANFGNAERPIAATGEGMVTVIRTDDACFFRLRMPCADTLGNESGLPLLLVVMQRNRLIDDFWDAERTVVVPLRIGIDGKPPDGLS